MNENKIIKKVNLDEDWEEFIKNEGLLDYNKIPLKRAKIRGWIKIAFWFLRIYILIMVIMVIIGFSRIH
ncbi:MAG: hypothetical protein M0Z72_01860 [Deltaproteobacteria bacterium]|nr:hypothetical protein [Deltaproteobacteria bacterium]